nr:DUF3180 domain-containing protein [Longispora sp. (in: high G+C Gram-positive bacteria)]
AITTRARIRRVPGAEPLDPLVVARYVVLAKASSLVGAIFTGVYTALALWLWVAAERLIAARGDLPGSLLGLAASVALLAASVWLEYSCRIPPSEDDRDDEGLPQE